MDETSITVAGTVDTFLVLLIGIGPKLALVPFVEITASLDAATKRRVQRQMMITAATVALILMLLGELLRALLHFTVGSLSIAGGIILFLVALDMVRGASYVPTGGSRDQETSIAIYPLAIPKIAGPGTMLTVVLLTDDHRFDFIQLSLTMGVLAVVLALTLGILLLAAPISRLIGNAGANIISRVMGMILVALAVHTVLSALAAWLGLPKL